MEHLGQPPKADLNLEGRTRIIPEANFWNIISIWAKALTYYVPIVEKYENAVLKMAQDKGKARRYLKLKPHEILNLVDSQELRELRQNFLFELKEMTKAALRNSSVEILRRIDLYSADLFHTVAIIKEVHTVLAYVAKDYQENKRTENETFLAEAHEEFPVYVHRIEQLMLRLRSLFNRSFSLYRDDQIFIRSLYLYGHDLFRSLPGYFNGLDDVYTLMYDYGPLEGYFHVSQAFKLAGFTKRCEQARAEIEKAYDRLIERVQLLGESPKDMIAEADQPLSSNEHGVQKISKAPAVEDPWLNREIAQVDVSAAEILKRTMHFIRKIEREKPSIVREVIRKVDHGKPSK